MSALITEWSTDDPGIAAMLREVAALPEASLERLTIEAGLHAWQAAHANRQIGRLIEEERMSARNRRAARSRRHPPAVSSDAAGEP